MKKFTIKKTIIFGLMLYLGIFFFGGNAQSALIGDLNNSGKVDIADYSMFIQDFGKTGTNLAADLNKNGQVEIGDYSIFISNFGRIDMPNDNVWTPKPVAVWTFQQLPICQDGRNSCPDIPRTAQALKDLGATAFFLPLGTEAQYNSLINFLKNSASTDIKIWVQMYHSCRQYPEPYRGDYIGDCQGWVEHLAQLSLQYPNLQAFVFDDFYPGIPEIREEVTPEFIKQVLAYKDAINPKLRFIPTLYYDSWDGLQYFRPGNKYNGVFDNEGVTMWYWASYGSKDRVVSLPKLQSYIDEARLNIPPSHFLTGIYTQKDGVLQQTNDPDLMFHDPAVLKQMIEMSYQKSDGLALFNFPLYMYDLDFFYQSTIFKRQTNDDPTFSYRLTNSGKGTYVSWYQAMKTTVPASAGSTIRVKFDMRDTRSSGDANYLFKQLLVNGQVIWEEDITTSSLRATIDKSVQIQSANANIAVRIFSKRANWISANAYLTAPTVYVNGNQVSAAWTFDSNLTKINEYKGIYSTVKNAILNSK